MTNKNQEKSLILVVDDSPEALGMLNEALETADMTTLVALEGKQALSIAKKMTPDIILLDAMMPNMDGFETCEHLKADAKLRHIPVIFMTGLSDTESIVKGFNSGGVDYLTKPIKPLELIARIKVHLHNARATLSAQNALDTTGRSLLAVDNAGIKLWSTPNASELLTRIENKGNLLALTREIEKWLSHKPKIGNKFQYSNNDITLIAIYVGLSVNDEHLIKISDDKELDEKMLLKEKFEITQREADVFLWLTKGKTNREIAQILDLSPRTVNKHLEQLFRKIDVDNRTTAAAMAIQHLQEKIGY